MQSSHFTGDFILQDNVKELHHSHVRHLRDRPRALSSYNKKSKKYHLAPAISIAWYRYLDLIGIILLLMVKHGMKGFNSLGLFFKKNFIRANANFLISTRHHQYTVKLYSWDKFLIEQYYDHDEEQITVITLAGKKDLEKYMKEISISELGLLTSL